MLEEEEVITSQNVEDKPAKSSGRQSVLLTTVLSPKKPVKTKTEDFLETSRDLDSEEYRKAFDKKVSGHSGFSASIRRNGTRA